MSSLFAHSFAFAASGTPPIISYQGRLADSSGNLLGGTGTTYYFKFSIWDNATVGNGTRLWPSVAPLSSAHTVRQGVFSVDIGDTGAGYPHSLDYNFNSNSDIYLQVEVSSDNSSFQTLSPRQRVSAAAFAQLSEAVSGATRPSSFGTTTPIGLSVVTIEATSTASVPLAIRAFLGQAANILDIQNSLGQSLVSVSSSGLLSSQQSSSTLSSVLDGLTIGRTATTTIRGESNATSTFAGGIFGNGLQISGFASTSALRVSLGLFQDGFTECSDEANTVLYNATSGKFSCGTDAGASGSGVSTIEENNSNVVTSALSIDFLGNDFNVALDGSEGDISIDYTNSGITRRNQDEIISGRWSFANSSSTLASVYNALYVGTTATTTISGTATSTFGAGIQTSYLNVTGTTATSTFANGISLNGGCFSVNGVCIGSNNGTVTSVNVSGGSTGLTASGGPVTSSGTITLAGTLNVTNGGTGWAAVQSGALLYGNGSSALATTTSGTNGQVLALLGGIPSWTATTTFGNGLTYSNGQASIDATASNVWTSLQQFSRASSTLASVYNALYVGTTATTTILGT
ncbi:MAG: hypothetical protein AAB381_01635, partial [Patescibacteria group bacterium]